MPSAAVCVFGVLVDPAASMNDTVAPPIPAFDDASVIVPEIVPGEPETAPPAEPAPGPMPMIGIRAVKGKLHFGFSR